MKTLEVCVVLTFLFGLYKAEDKFGEDKFRSRDFIKDVFFTDKIYQSRNGGWKYSLSTFYLDRNSALKACERSGGQLARISSQEKFTFITNWLEDLSPYNKQQIHINGRYTGNKWIYDNNSQGVFLIWHSDDPSAHETGSGQESCLVLERRRRQFKMNDVSCNGVELRFLCEQQLQV